MAAARWGLSRATDLDRICSGKLLAVLYIALTPWLYCSDCGGSLRRLLELEAESPRDPFAIGRIGAQAIGNVPLLDVQARVAHCAGGVVEEPLLLVGRHQTEKITRLLPVIIIDAMVIMRPVAVHRHWQFGEVGLIVPQPVAVGIKGQRAAEIAVSAHFAVAM